MISNFFKNPNIQFKNDNAVKDALKELFAVFWYCLLFSGISLLVVSLIDFVIKLNHQFSFMDAIDHAQQQASTSRGFLFFLVVAPIAEELIFRLPLKVKRLNIFVALVMAYGIFYLSHKSVATLFSLTEVLKAITFILICLEILYCLKDEFFNAISTRYFSLYFYALTITFGLLHVRNYIDLVPSNLVLLAPIFAIPQIIGGFFLGYFRLKRGLFWSILLHAVINTPTTLFYFVKH